jgi:hypothetical protein
MYCNPHVKSFPTQRFVASALSTGRLLQILPSFGDAHRCLNTNQTRDIVRNPVADFSILQLPTIVAEERTKLWIDQIKEDVQRKRDE